MVTGEHGPKHVEKAEVTSPPAQAVQTYWGGLSTSVRYCVQN